MTNRGQWTVSLALWALSQMAQGGVAVMPLPPRGSHEGNLQPTSRMALWAYTDMSDARWMWGKQYVLLSQDSEESSPQKAGFSNMNGWMAYARNGHLLVKFISPMEKRHYPDMGVNTELFTNDAILELENLGPVEHLAPGESAELIERWLLVKGISDIKTEEDVIEQVLPYIQ
jgi:hypothetical protein